MDSILKHFKMRKRKKKLFFLIWSFPDKNFFPHVETGASLTNVLQATENWKPKCILFPGKGGGGVIFDQRCISPLNPTHLIIGRWFRSTFHNLGCSFWAQLTSFSGTRKKALSWILHTWCARLQTGLELEYLGTLWAFIEPCYIDEKYHFHAKNMLHFESGWKEK